MTIHLEKKNDHQMAGWKSTGMNRKAYCRGLGRLLKALLIAVSNRRLCLYAQSLDMRMGMDTWLPAYEAGQYHPTAERGRAMMNDQCTIDASADQHQESCQTDVPIMMRDASTGVFGLTSVLTHSDIMVIAAPFAGSGPSSLVSAS